MKNSTLLTALSIAMYSFESCNGASIVIDNFNSGPFSISSGSDTADISLIASPIAESRWARGSGSNNWSASVNGVTGTLTYTLNVPRTDPSPTTRFEVTYFDSTSNLNLLGFNAFVLHVSNFSGIGQVYAFEGTGSTLDGVTPVPFNSIGDLVIPFDYMNASDPFNPSAITFWIVPESSDFSITLSGISVIPEPSVALLALLGASSLLLRRRTRNI